MSGRERLFVSISAAAGLACALVALVLMQQIDRARTALQDDGVLEFNFVRQLDHDFDAFAHELADYRAASLRHAEGGPPPEPAGYLRRYDLLYSVLSRIDTRWGGSALMQPRADATVASMTDFLAASEHRIEPGIVLGRDEVDALIESSRAQSRALYGIGTLLYIEKARFRDGISARMDRLSSLFRFFGASFLLAGLTLYLLLTRASRRARRAFEEASTSQRQLQVALEKLTSGDLRRQSQNRFLAASTHDLRQPLQAMQYYLKALEQHVPGERGREILERVGRSADSAQRLLTSLLDISRLDAGVFDATPRPVGLEELLQRLRDAYRPEAEQRGLELHIDTTELWVHTDGTVLERVLGNLLGNALAYTREGGVSLSVDLPEGAAANESVRISIADTGIGIPAAELDAVFDEYYRSSHAAEHGHAPGIGLGLSIVKRLTGLLDIPLHVSSELGRGTRFELRVPREPAGMARRSVVGSRADRNAETVGRLAILLIDDERDVREGMATMFSQVGCEVLSASNAEEALEHIVRSGKVPDLILADYRLLHGRTGVQAIELVREEVNEDVPAILITGDTAPERLREATASGFRLLHKPIGVDALFEAIGTTMRKAS